MDKRINQGIHFTPEQYEQVVKIAKQMNNPSLFRDNGKLVFSRLARQLLTEKAETLGLPFGDSDIWGGQAHAFVFIYKGEDGRWTPVCGSGDQERARYFGSYYLNNENITFDEWKVVPKSHLKRWYNIYNYDNVQWINGGQDE